VTATAVSKQWYYDDSLRWHMATFWCRDLCVWCTIFCCLHISLWCSSVSQRQEWGGPRFAV